MRNGYNRVSRFITAVKPNFNVKVIVSSSLFAQLARRLFDPNFPALVSR
jgi:hypothetical protein